VQDSNGSRLKLSFAQANALCLELVPIGDEAYHYATQLENAGFNASMPRRKFIESFAETAEELELHRRCVVENAKERLGQPTPIRIFDEDFKQLYFSPFLQQLREQRDRDNGCPVAELHNRYKGAESWRREIDPCQRRLVQDGEKHRESHKARFAAMLEAESSALKDEAEHFSTGLGKNFSVFDSKGRSAFYRDIMERGAATLGFHYDREKSRPNYPIFSKQMTDNWHLCWALENARSFFPNPSEGRFDVSLELRSKQLTGRLDKVDSGELLVLRYAAILPNFLGAYARFVDLDQLERIIHAHLYLYRLMAPALENGIKNALSEFRNLEL
jgi:hypothetical protein